MKGPQCFHVLMEDVPSFWVLGQRLVSTYTTRTSTDSLPVLHHSYHQQLNFNSCPAQATLPHESQSTYPTTLTLTSTTDTTQFDVKILQHSLRHHRSAGKSRLNTTPTTGVAPSAWNP